MSCSVLKSTPKLSRQGQFIVTFSQVSCFDYNARADIALKNISALLSSHTSIEGFRTDVKATVPSAFYCHMQNSNLQCTC